MTAQRQERWRIKPMPTNVTGCREIQQLVRSPADHRRRWREVIWTPGHFDDEHDKRIADKIVAAHNNTYAVGINPKAVEDMRDALFKLHSWGRVFVENTPISAETLWREFPMALKAAETALANAKLGKT